MRFHRDVAIPSALGRLGTVLAVFWAVAASATPITQLQVLLPGETAAPGTPGGKTGAPYAQVVGVPFTVVVRACDGDGNLVTSASDQVRLTSTLASALVPAPALLIGGQVAFSVVLPAAGTARFTAQDQTDLLVPLGGSANVTAVVLGGFRFQDTAPRDRQVGVAFATSLTAIDAGGNVVLGYHGPVELQELTSLGVGRVEPAVVQLASGVWSGSLTVYRADETNLQLGSARVHAHLPGDPGRSGTSDTFIARPGSLARLQLLAPGMTAWPGSVAGYEGSPASQAATAPFTVSVQATDTWWNPLPSTHQVRLVSSDSWATTPLTMTLAGGRAQAAVALATTGEQTLTAYDLDDAGVAPMVIPPLLVTAAAASHFQFSTLPAAVTAGQPFNATIRAVDAGGATIPTFDGSARLVPTTGPGTMTPEAVTFSDGVWTGQLTCFGADPAVTVACQDYATPPHQGASAAVAVAPGAWTGLQVLLPGQSALPGTGAGVIGTPAAQAAGQPFTLLVRAIDDWFNLVPGAAGALALAGSDPRLAVPGTPALAGGECALAVTPFRAGEQTVEATAADRPAVAGATSAAYAVAAGPYAKLLLTLPGQAPQPGAADGREGAADDQSITWAFTATVRATDEWFNPLPLSGDQVQLACSDPLAQVDAPRALVDGQAAFTVRLATGGYQLLTATNLTQAAMASSSTQVRAISSGLHLVAAIGEEAVAAGSPFTLTVSAVNDAGSVIQEANPQVTVAVLGAHDQAPGRGVLSTTTFQLLQGRRTVSLDYTYAEDIVLRLTDDAGSTPAVTAPLRVVPGDPVAIALSGEPRWVRPGGTVTLSARVTDTCGNVIPEQSVTFQMAANAFGSLAAAGGKGLSLATGPGGVATALYLAPTFAHEATVTASCGAASAGLAIVTAVVNPDAGAGYLTSYPNPFHPGEGPATIVWNLDAASEVRLQVWTTSGSLVLDRRFAAGEPGGTAGTNAFEWNATNGDGEPVASGGYVVRVEAQGDGATEHVMRRKLGVVW